MMAVSRMARFISQKGLQTLQHLRSMEVLCEKAGAEVVAKMAVLAEGDAAKREDITVLAPLPLFTADGTPIDA